MNNDQIIELTIREVANQTKIAIQPNMQRQIAAAVKTKLAYSVTDAQTPQTPKPAPTNNIIHEGSQRFFKNGD